MGWWGMNDSTKESIVSFREMFQKIIDDADPEWFITIVVCHI
jgi:hypothetical protein